MRPLIGISLGLDDRGRWRPGRDYLYTDTAYAHAVVECGALAVHLPIQERVESLVERIDGLVLPGGDDFPPPGGYPEAVAFEPAPSAQIRFDRQLLAAALARGLPVLGICYGMQLLALHFGGTLHYDLPTDVPSASPHRLPEPEGRHPIDVEKGTALADLLGRGIEPVNSLHHQAVALPGEGLRVAARAPDGIVEAIERTSGPFCLGVQWHPEKMEAAHRGKLFGAFVDACDRRGSPERSV